MSIRIHIDRLVLEGLPVTSAQGPALREALQRELSIAMAAGGLSAELRTGGAFPVVRAASAKLHHENPSQMGTQIARSIHGAIGRAK